MISRLKAHDHMFMMKLKKQKMDLISKSSKNKMADEKKRKRRKGSDNPPFLGLDSLGLDLPGFKGFPSPKNLNRRGNANLKGSSFPILYLSMKGAQDNANTDDSEYDSEELDELFDDEEVEISDNENDTSSDDELH